MLSYLKGQGREIQEQGEEICDSRFQVLTPWEYQCGPSSKRRGGRDRLAAGTEPSSHNLLSFV